jgi:hypothetical protein
MTRRKSPPSLLQPRVRKRPKTFLPAGPARTLHDFSLAYSAAATKLAGKRRVGSIDDMPILFSFRHAIELAIKAVLIHAGTREEEVFKRGHNLLEQLPDLQKIALRRGSPLTA